MAACSSNITSYETFTLWNTLLSGHTTFARYYTELQINIITPLSHVKGIEDNETLSVYKGSTSIPTREDGSASRLEWSTQYYEEILTCQIRTVSGDSLIYPSYTLS